MNVRRLILGNRKDPMVDVLMTLTVKAVPVVISMVRVVAVEGVILDWVITNAQKDKAVLSMKWAMACAVKTVTREPV